MKPTHTVFLSERAKDDVRRSYRWLITHRRVPAAALRPWIARFEKTIASLAVRPEVWPLAKESRRSSRPLHQKLFGRQPHVFRNIFAIDGNVVHVLRIRRASRRGLSQREIDELK